MRNILLGTCFILMSYGLYAQAPLHCFFTDDTLGCVPHTVRITNCNKSTSPTSYVYMPNQSAISDTFFTYTQPGVYDVTQLIAGRPVSSSTKPKYIRVVGTVAPEFEANVCADKFVSVLVKSVGFDFYEVDFGDGSPLQQATPSVAIQHQYADLSQRTITVTGKYVLVSCSLSSTRKVEPIDQLIKPDVQSLKVVSSSSTSGQVSLHCKTLPYLEYAIGIKEAGASTFNYIDTIRVKGNDTTYVITGLNTLFKTYCVQFVCFDRCGNQIVSEEVCTVVFDVQDQNNRNELLWDTYPYNAKVVSQKIIKDNALFTNPNVGVVQLYDSAIVCGNDYCYKLVLELSQLTASNQPITIESISKCVKANSSDIPNPVDSFYVSIVDGNVVLTWNKVSSSVGSYLIMDESNNLIKTLQGSSTTTTFSDVSLNEVYCYSIQVKDVCGNLSNSGLNKSACSMVLKKQSENTTQLKISWTEYLNFNSGIKEYILEWMDQKGVLIKSQQYPAGQKEGLLDIDEPSNPIFYLRVKAVPIGNEPSMYSNQIEVKQEPKLFFPTAFSPNKDGINDVFLPKYRFISRFELEITDRWGAVMFKSESLTEGWDGTYNGKEVPEGVYTYTSKAIDVYEKERVNKGTILIVY